MHIMYYNYYKYIIKNIYICVIFASSEDQENLNLMDFLFINLIYKITYIYELYIYIYIHVIHYAYKYICMYFYFIYIHIYISILVLSIAKKK